MIYIILSSCFFSLQTALTHKASLQAQTGGFKEIDFDHGLDLATGQASDRRLNYSVAQSCLALNYLK